MTETEQLNIAGRQASDAYGASVALCDNYAIIGSPWIDSKTGAAFVFIREEAKSAGSSQSVPLSGGLLLALFFLGLGWRALRKKRVA